MRLAILAAAAVLVTAACSPAAGSGSTSPEPLPHATTLLLFCDLNATAGTFALRMENHATDDKRVDYPTVIFYANGHEIGSFTDYDVRETIATGATFDVPAQRIPDQYATAGQCSADDGT